MRRDPRPPTEGPRSSCTPTPISCWQLQNKFRQMTVRIAEKWLGTNKDWKMGKTKIFLKVSVQKCWSSDSWRVWGFQCPPGSHLAHTAAVPLGACPPCGPHPEAPQCREPCWGREPTREPTRVQGLLRKAQG